MKKNLTYIFVIVLGLVIQSYPDNMKGPYALLECAESYEYSSESDSCNICNKNTRKNYNYYYQSDEQEDSSSYCESQEFRESSSESQSEKSIESPESYDKNSEANGSVDSSIQAEKIQEISDSSQSSESRTGPESSSEYSTEDNSEESSENYDEDYSENSIIKSPKNLDKIEDSKNLIAVKSGADYKSADINNDIDDKRKRLSFNIINAPGMCRPNQTCVRFYADCFNKACCDNHGYVDVTRCFVIEGPACVCDKGYVWNRNGDCVKLEDCPRDDARRYSLGDWNKRCCFD